MRLLLIEDSLRLQDSLRAGFEEIGFAIDIVGDGERGLIFARRQHYDVVILDLTLPKLDGLEIIRQLRSEEARVHILVLSARAEAEDRIRGLELGADDYLAKPFHFDELVARVRALVRRRYESKSPWIRIGDLSIDTVGQRVTIAGQGVVLTRREFLILEYMARRSGEVLSQLEIEDHVYGEHNLPESNTVQSAMSTLRKKLSTAAGYPIEVIRTIRGLGYSLGSVRGADDYSGDKHD